MLSRRRPNSPTCPPSRSPTPSTGSPRRWRPSFPAEPGGRPKRWIAPLKFVLAALLLFGAFVAMMAWSQDELLFPTHAVAPADPLPQGAERLSIDLEGDHRLHGVYIPPLSGGDRPRTLVIGFGGNAWNGENVALYLQDLYPAAHVAAFHYRGYAPSTGKPSAEALIADAPRVLDSAIGRVKPQRVVAVGFSIGSGVAASLANRRGLDGLVLVTPFDSLKAVASEIYPWLPVGFAFRHELNTAEYLHDTDVPVAIVAAARDEIIPPRRTEALRGKVPNLVFDRTIGGAGHNDIYVRPEFEAAMHEALEAVSNR